MYLTKEQLEKLPTKRLLAYKKKNFPHPGKIDCSECIDTCHNYNEYARCSQYGPEYIETYETIKSILATREHVKRRSI